MKCMILPCCIVLTAVQGKDARVTASAALGHKFFQGTPVPSPAAADAAALQAFACARGLLNSMCEEVALEDPRCQAAADAAKWQHIKDACDEVAEKNVGGSA
jgi:hypothetical protein